MGHQIAAMFCDFEPIFTRIRDRLQSASARFVRFSRLLKFAVFLVTAAGVPRLSFVSSFRLPDAAGPAG